MFIEETTITNILPGVVDEQKNNHDYLNNLAKSFPLKCNNGIWFHNQRIVVPENNDLQRGVIYHYHDTKTAGHPRQR